jgi:hypothetical protein
MTTTIPSMIVTAFMVIDHFYLRNHIIFYGKTNPVWISSKTIRCLYRWTNTAADSYLGLEHHPFVPPIDTRLN